jgi:long-chain acyl-CoA synthetase
MSGLGTLELASLVNRHARYRSAAPAVVFQDQRLAWGAFGMRVARVGNLLRELGIDPGDRVATFTSNSLELLEIYWAVPSIGAVLVPFSPLLLPAGLASLLRDCGARCLLTSAALLPVLENIRDELPEHVLLTDGSRPGYHDYHALAARQPDSLRPAQVTPEALFNIMYTSGTTGEPKGIMHSHFIRAMYGVLMASAWRMSPESRTLHTGAIVFNGAFVTLMPSFCLGATWYMHPRFDVEAVLSTVERERITHTMLVPAQIAALLDSPGFDPARLASLECLLSLGAPLLEEQRDQLNELLPGRLYELYGLTEGMVTILDREDVLRKRGSVGRPPLFFDIRVLGDDGRETAPGEIGEIVGRGPILMPGYYRRDELTASAIREGWLHSGDMGYLDDEGYLYLVDRKKDMIDSGGVKVYPRDIEEIAARHAAVREVAVFGVPDPKWGEAPVAAVILREGADTTPQQLCDWINERVSARYQRVREVVITRDFPRNAAGKTLKRELRAPWWAGQGRNI